MARAVDSTESKHPVAFSLAAARELSVPPGQLSAPVFAHGSMQLKLYRPRGVDQQQPHTRDELYFVARGAGTFVHGPERYAFRTGDVLFAAAHTPHRFEHFGEDLQVWVVFYGPEGGEAVER